MGPITRYLGSEVPTEKLIWQDNVPEKDLNLIPKEDKIKEIKVLIRSSGLTIPQLVETAWASAST
jgi:catalase-peroxidase